MKELVKWAREWAKESDLATVVYILCMMIIVGGLMRACDWVWKPVLHPETSTQVEADQ